MELGIKKNEERKIIKNVEEGIKKIEERKILIKIMGEEIKKLRRE